MVICVALAVGACADHELQKLARVRDSVCACKTAACAEAAMGDIPKGKVESTPRSQRIAREMMNCLAELYELGRPTDDPDAELPIDEASAGSAR
jgi:hypothetical protein